MSTIPPKSHPDKITAIYMRVSTAGQSLRSQKPDIDRWLKAQDPDTLGPVKWFRDKATGRNTDRPGWQKLQAEIDAGQVQQVVCWRLDRLGRSAAGLCKLFEELKARKINLISLKESVDLKSASGRLLAHIMASVAAFESELKSERIIAGQAVARERGVKWGGSQKGRLLKTTPQQIKIITRMKTEGEKAGNIAQAVGLDRSTVHRLLNRIKEGHIAP